MLSSTTGVNSIHFGDGGGNNLYAGYIQYVHANNSLQFGTSHTEKMRLDTSGNLLVGNTSAGGVAPSNIQSIGIDVMDGSNTISGSFRNYSSAANSAGIQVDPDSLGANSILYFYIDGAHKMQLNQDGRLSIDSNATRTATGALNLLGTVGTADSGGNYQAIAFRHAASTIVGTVTTTASATSYNTSSDYRLKENVDYDFNALDRVAQLKPARFNFIADADNTVDGFLAHEVSSIVPEAITGQKDAMMDEEYEITPAVLNADGTIITEAVMGTHSVPNYQSIDQSKLVPLLTKAIQEQQTIIDDLKSRIETLEG
jgi:hypothetical protein